VYVCMRVCVCVCVYVCVCVFTRGWCERESRGAHIMSMCKQMRLCNTILKVCDWAPELTLRDSSLSAWPVGLPELALRESSLSAWPVGLPELALRESSLSAWPVGLQPDR
jgi:hypothetical protein